MKRRAVPTLLRAPEPLRTVKDEVEDEEEEKPAAAGRRPCAAMHKARLFVRRGVLLLRWRANAVWVVVAVCRCCRDARNDEVMEERAAIMRRARNEEEAITTDSLFPA